MLSVRRIAAHQLLQRNTYHLGFGKKRKPTPSDLEKYDVVVIGAGLGSVFATHLDAVVGEKYKIYLTYQNPTTEFYPQRNLYEQGTISKSNFSSPTRQIVSKNIGQSDYIGVDRINPSANEITLRNGRTIKYENLVIGLGQKNNYQSITGFEQAWADTMHPFYTNLDHLSWKTTVSKAPRVHLNFNGGPAYFYIPQGGYQGQIQDLNFLVSKGYWDLHATTGKINWQTSSLTVINPNRTFCSHFNKVDHYLRKICAEKNIKIEQDLVLVEVRKVTNPLSQNNQVAVFRDINSGQLIQRPYESFYSLMPTTTHSLLADSGLADHTGYLDVNPHTLQHTKYDNIFGVGDVLNVPTTKSFYGGLAQVAVVRHNVQRKLNGLSLNAKYDGYTKLTLPIAPSALANIQHQYDGKQVRFDTQGFSASLRFSLYGMTGKHATENIYKFKNWGPPYYKFKKSFEGGQTKPATAPATLQPEKKAA